MDYPLNLIETLYNTHIKKPNTIIGCDVRRIAKGKSYKKWRKNTKPLVAKNNVPGAII